MSITMMCNENDPGAKPSSYPDVWVRETHVGVVLYLRERNGYDDSDFIAGYWDDESGSIKEIEYATTRGWTYPNHAGVDATPEVLAKYEAYRKARRDEAEALRQQASAGIAALGDKVVISLKAGKNKAHSGKSGAVFWIGFDKYAYKNPETVLGVKLDDGTKLFLKARNCQRIGAQWDCQTSVSRMSLARQQFQFA